MNYVIILSELNNVDDSINDRRRNHATLDFIVFVTAAHFYRVERVQSWSASIR